MLSRITGPGLHAKLPYVDIFEMIQVTLQVDRVTDIPCGTKGGVNIVFEKIEVVNRLKREAVYDTIKEYGEYEPCVLHDS